MMKEPAGVDAELVSAIWGLDSSACGPDLGAFLEREISWISGFHPPLERRDVPYLVAVLKANPNVPRSKIQSAMEESCRGAASYPGVTLPGSIPPSLSRAILSGAGKNETVVPKTLKNTVRIMLGLSLNVEGKGGLGFRESWEPSQSLQKVIETIFPSGSDEKPTNAAPTPIKQTKLRAFYLKDYAGVTLVWTRNISEHLSLSTSDTGPKSLTVFKHVSLLEAEQVALEGEENADMKLDESLALWVLSSRNHVQDIGRLTKHGTPTHQRLLQPSVYPRDAHDLQTSLSTSRRQEIETIDRANEFVPSQGRA